MHYEGWAKAAGHATSGRVETGAVTGVHRAGASLNVHVHFHVLCLDGVYVDDGEALRFEPAPAPTRAELTSMLQRIYARVMKWLSRRGLLRDPDDAHDSNASREVSPAEALATAGMQRGSLVTVREPTPSTPRALEALEAGDGRAAFVLDALVATRALTTTGIAELLAPNNPIRMRSHAVRVLPLLRHLKRTKAELGSSPPVALQGLYLP